jgi:hypothetical protein
MVFKKIVRKLIGLLDGARNWSQESKTIENLHERSSETEEKKKIFSLWDFVDFQADTQADHLAKVVGFEEFVDMDEIRRRIHELMQIEYKNERSLYPYIKTLADLGFFETNNVGGRRKWRKREMLFEIVTEEDREKADQQKAKTEHKLLEIQAIDKRKKRKRIVI